MTTDEALPDSSDDCQVKGNQNQGVSAPNDDASDCSQPSSPHVESHALLVARLAAEQNRAATAHFLRLDTRAAAKYIGTCPRSLAYWRDKKIGPPYQQIGSKIWYVLPILDAWIAHQLPGRFQTCAEARHWNQDQVAALKAEKIASEFSPPAIGNLTRKQTAQFLGVSIRLLDSWRGQTEQPQPMANGTKRVRYSIADLDAWLKLHFNNA